MDIYIYILVPASPSISVRGLALYINWWALYINWWALYINWWALRINWWELYRKWLVAIYRILWEMVGAIYIYIYEVLAALDIFKKRGNYKRESGILALASHTCCRHCFLSHVI